MMADLDLLFRSACGGNVSAGHGIWVHTDASGKTAARTGPAPIDAARP